MKRQRKELIYHNITSVHKPVIYPLLISFIVSCFNVPAMALSASGSFDHLPDEALPTAEPELSEAAEDLPDIRTDNDNYVLPEKADKRLVDDRMDVSFTKEELYGDPQKHSFNEIYFSYIQLISGDEEYIEKLNGLYSESISSENETAYDILSPYFDDNTIKELEEHNAADENINIYKLFACFMEYPEFNDDEKNAVYELIQNGNTIKSALNSFMLYKKDVEDGITTQSENISEQISSYTSRMSEDDSSREDDDTRLSANSAGYRTVTPQPGHIFADDVTAPKYYTPQAQNIYVDGKSGNLIYTRHDIEIPLTHGYMTLDLRYDVSDAKMAMYCDEEWEGGGSLHASISNPDYYENPLGAGWRFNLTRIENNILYLKDGRNIAVNATGKVRNVYKDVTVTHNSTVGYIVTYIDGSEEHINNSGLMYESIDRWGSITEYEYTSINDQDTLSSMTSQGRTLTIDYNDYSTVINKPNGDKVKYLKEDISFQYGAIYNRTWQKTSKVLSKVVLNDGSDELCDAFFYYTPKEALVYSGYVGSIYCVDYYVIAAISEIQGADGACYAYSYEPNTLSIQNNTRTYNIKAKTKRIIEFDGVGGERQYSDITYNYCTTINNGNYNKVTEAYSNDKTEIREYHQNYNTSNTYETVDGIEILRISETEQYDQNYEYLLLSRENVQYNRNGNYITNKHEYEYNSNEQLISDKLYIDGVLDSQTDYEYTSGFLTKTTYTRNNTIQYKNIAVRNSYGDVTTEYTQRNSTVYGYTEYTYDNYHRLSAKRTKENASAAVYEYDEEYSYANNFCLPETVQNKNGNTVLQSTSYTYDADNGNVLTKTDGNGNTTRYNYDARGNITSQLTEDGVYTTIEYNVDGYNYYYTLQPVIVKHDNGYSQKYKYTHTGKVREVSERDWYTSEPYTVTYCAEYDVYDNLISQTDAEGNTITIQNDIFGRQTSVTYPAVSGTTSQPVRAYYYDVFFDGSQKCSAVLTVDQTNKASISYYNIYGENYKNAVIKNMSSLTGVDWDNITELPSNTQLVITQTNEFDDMGRVILSYDGENRQKYCSYDGLGRVIYEGVGTGTEAYCNDYSYDSVGNLKSSYLGRQYHTYTHDLAGRLTQHTDPMGFTETYTYDLAGNMTSSKDKNGDYTYYTYNIMNRLISKTKLGSTISYTYDDMGNVLTSTDSSGTISYEYNIDSTLLSKEYPDGREIEYTYTPNKQVSCMTDYFGNTTDYTYNGRGAITSISEQYHGTNDQKTTNYSYNDDGSIAHVNIPNRNMKTYYTYDYAGRVTYLNNTAPYLSAKARFTYTYDNSGNITGISQYVNNATITKTYTYDSANRLSYESSSNGHSMNYSYDWNNNLISAIGDGDTYYTYDDNNRLIQIEDLWCYKNSEDGLQLDDWQIDYTYDNNGNLLSSDTYSPDYDGSYIEYEYNAWGQLTDYSDTLGKTAAYSYYSDGLRSSKTVDNSTIKYYYNGGDVINETKNNAEYATNVMGVDGIISRRVNNYASYYYKNLHGDVVYGFTEGAWRSYQYDYGAWGNEYTSYDYYASSKPNPIHYSGEYYDHESGLTYLRGRYYSSELRRFITEDPAKDGMNWYAYCGNNPVMFVDPWGLVDVPYDGTKSFVNLVNSLGSIIYYQAAYNNLTGGIYDIMNDFIIDTKKERLHSLAQGVRGSINVDEIRNYSNALADLVNDVVVSGEGTMQQTSAVLALVIELKDDVVHGSKLSGEEILSEDSVIQKYNYYTSTGDVFLGGEKKAKTREELIGISPQANLQEDTFCGYTSSGYWVKIIYYDKYLDGRRAFSYDNTEWKLEY